VIDDLVFENANEPRPLRAATGECVVRLQRGQQRLLHYVFRECRVAQAEQGIAEEGIAMPIYPRARIGRGQRRGLCFMSDGRLRFVSHRNWLPQSGKSIPRLTAFVENDARLDVDDWSHSFRASVNVIVTSLARVRQLILLNA